MEIKDYPTPAALCQPLDAPPGIMPRRPIRTATVRERTGLKSNHCTLPALRARTCPPCPCGCHCVWHSSPSAPSRSLSVPQVQGTREKSTMSTRSTSSTPSTSPTTRINPIFADFQFQESRFLLPVAQSMPLALSAICDGAAWPSAYRSRTI